MVREGKIKTIGVIPARYKSSRFPGKPLADILGKPMVWWVWRQAIKVPDFKQVYVATDDVRIAAACKELKIPVLMTSTKHKTGTDRVGEVAKEIKADLYVNIQGDEPLIDTATIKSAITPFLKQPGKIRVTNLMTQIKRRAELFSFTVPKVVFNAQKEAIFLSRFPIPYPKSSRPLKYYKQVCVYGLTREILQKFCELPRGISEKAEDIELLRFLEHNIPVQMVEVFRDSMAVDTPGDLRKVINILSKTQKIKV